MKRTRVYQGESKQGFRLADIEADLWAAFQPVKPRPSFISESRSRLVTASKQRRSQMVVFQFIVLAIAGMASSVLILVMSIRATITLLGTLGILYEVREQTRKKRAISARPAL